MRIPKRKLKTALHVDRWIIEGYLHLLPGEDFATFSAGKRQRFVAVTQARILDRETSKEIASVEHLELNSRRVSLFYPLNKDVANDEA